MRAQEEIKKPDFRALLKELPPFVARTHPRFRELIGYSPRSMANIDSLGCGPPNRIRLGNTVAYERESSVRWLEDRSRVLLGNALTYFSRASFRMMTQLRMLQPLF